MTTDGHNATPNGEVDAQSVQQGHEPDRINARGLIYVPIVLLVCFFLTYTTVTLVIGYVRAPSDKKPDLPLAAQKNAAPLNDRLGNISSTSPTAETKQPRLEGLERVKSEGEPTFLRSFEPTAEGNSPHYHPEDLRVSSALGKSLGLQDYGKNKDGTIRIPVEEALKIVLQVKNPKKPDEPYLRVRAVELDQLLLPGPKASNPQWAGPPKPAAAQTETPTGAHP